MMFYQRSSVGTEVTSTSAEPGLERIGELEIRPRPFGARLWREGLGERASAGRFRPVSHEASVQSLGRIGEFCRDLAVVFWLWF